MHERDLRRFRILLTHFIEHIGEHIEELKEFEKKLDDEGMIQLIEDAVDDLNHGRDKLKRILNAVG